MAARAHAHAEAYCLMGYQSDDGTEQATIWNSRDGVTPLVVTLPSGRVASHVHWARDQYDPGHQPKPGDLVFTDLTPERALALAARRIQLWLQGNAQARGLIDTYGSVAAAFAGQVQFGPGEPDLRTWPIPPPLVDRLRTQSTAGVATPGALNTPVAHGTRVAVNPHNADPFIGVLTNWWVNADGFTAEVRPEFSGSGTSSRQLVYPGLGDVMAEVLPL